MEHLLSRVVIGTQNYQSPVEGYQWLYDTASAQWLLVPLTSDLDSWYGDIITVPKQYRGSISRVVIRKGSEDLPVPGNLEVGDNCELHAFGILDTGSAAAKCGMRATVTRPDGSQLTGAKEMWTSQDPGEELRFSIMNIPVELAGTWSASIEYYTLD